MSYEIPREATLPFFAEPIAVHWDLHAIAMVSIWLFLVPIAILTIRYGKPRPAPNGIPRGTANWSKLYFWWPVHFYLLYAAVGGTLAVGGFAILLSGGISGTLHSFFALATMIFAVLQIVSAWYRGSHGGMRDPGADPADPATWRGDHFDFTTHRRLFEAWHKSFGHFTAIMALGAITTGLAQFHLPGVTLYAVSTVAIIAGLVVLFEALGLRHDTYQSVYGNRINFPGNRKRALGSAPLEILDAETRTAQDDRPAQ